MNQQLGNNPIGDLSRFFNEEELKDLKEKLEVQYQALLSRTKPTGKYILMCKEKGCDFVFEFDEIDQDLFRLHHSNAVHTCDSFLASDQLAFFKNRKKVIDMKETVYQMMKQRCHKYDFEKPKVILSIIANKFQSNTYDLLYGDVENIEDRRRIKKKFDNLVGEIKNRILNEDPHLKAKYLEEKRKGGCKKRRSSNKKKLTGANTDDQSLEIITRPKKARKREDSQYEGQSELQFQHQPIPDLHPNLKFLKGQRQELPNPRDSRIYRTPEQIDVESESEQNPELQSSSLQVEYEIKPDPRRDTVLYLHKGFIRKDGRKVTDLCQWRKINMRITQREERDLKRKLLGIKEENSYR